ncbi:MAG: hypothetical protein Q4B26_06695 [Eubacteriales bacterium]|nr:hypothetical protein [Eubacteriales bacterium]
MRKKLLAGILAGILGTGCFMGTAYGEVVIGEWIYTETAEAPEGTAAEAQGSAVTATSKTINEDELAAAKEQYRIILSQPGNYDYFYEGTDMDNNFEYSLVMLHNKDTVPTLVVSRDAQSSQLTLYKVFRYNPETGSVIESKTYFDSVFRGGLLLEADGDGFANTAVFLQTQETVMQRVSFMDDGTLVTEEQWTGGWEDPSEPGTIEMVFTSVADTSALDNWSMSNQTGIQGGQQGGAANASGGSTQSTSGGASLDQAIADEQAQGRQVLTGTYRLCSYDEVIQLQGQPNPNGSYGADKTYPMIVFDGQQMVTGTTIDDYQDSRMTFGVYVTDSGVVDASYAGQSVTFSYNPATSFWQSDTSIPLGALRTSDVRILQ